MQPVSNSIQIIGPIGTLCDGYAYHNRAFIKMLYNHGFNIKCISAEPGAKGVPMAEDSELIKILTEGRNKPEGDIIFNFCVPHMYTIQPNKINLGFTTWEVDKLPLQWTQQINKLHAIFVPSEQVKKVFLDSGVQVPIYVLSYPIDMVKLESIEPVTVSAEIPRKLTFLYSGGCTPRKNLEDLLLAYCSVFDKVDDVLLVIKTWSPNNDNNSRIGIQQSIGNLAGKISCERRPKISVVTDHLEDDQYRALVKGADVCISTSKGEGLDSFIVESMALGKPCIVDMNMGRMDYVFSNSAYVVDTTQRPVVDSGVHLHSTKMNWYSPVYTSLTEKMIQAYHQYDTANGQKIRQNAKKNILEMYNIERVVNKFNDDLKTIVNLYEQKTGKSVRAQLQKVALAEAARVGTGATNS